MIGVSRLLPIIGLVAGAAAMVFLGLSWGKAPNVPTDLRGWLFAAGGVGALVSLGYILSLIVLRPGIKGQVAAHKNEPAMLRPITIPDTSTADHVETPDDALLMLESMVGLVPVKEELRSLMARAKVDALRRAQGAQVASVSQHMVFTGPPGVGKTEVARILGAVFHQTKMLRKGHLVETDRAGLVASYVGQTAARTLDKCREALDGILFIDEAYTLVGGGYAQDFGAEAVDTLLKFMEDNRDRIVVIVAGYPDQMKGFINMNPGLAGRFTRYIDFPAYAANDLLEILNRMAKSQGFSLPEDTAELAQSWLAERMTAKDWSNAREMRSLLERMREAQAVRIAAHTNPDLNRLTSDDLRQALRPRR